jgi:hypothetical protein
LRLVADAGIGIACRAFISRMTTRTTRRGDMQDAGDAVSVPCMPIATVYAAGSGALVTRIIGCTCGWVVPPTTTRTTYGVDLEIIRRGADSDDLWAHHAADRMER